MPIITICSSASFYEQVIDVQTELIALGFEVLLPKIARVMQQSGDYDVMHYKTWYEDARDYYKKTALIREHFSEIERADAVLVCNYEKRGEANYIGGNVLMEMTIAFYLNKPIYLLNDIPRNSSFLEEIIAVGAKPLFGDVSSLSQQLPR